MMHRLWNIFRIGRVKLIDDTDVVQRMQVYEGDLGAYGGQRIIDRVPRIVHFGLLSVPPLDSEVILAAPGGERTQTIALGTNHQASRPKNYKPGDSGIYDVRGAKLTLTEAGCELDAAGLQVTIRNASKVRCECDVETTGDVISRADGTRVSLNALRDAYEAHHHSGVASGSALTGLTDHNA